MANLTQDQWKEGVEAEDNAQILDVRTEEEFTEKHIPNSLNIDIYKGQEFLDEVNKLDKTKSYYVYCRSGARSAQACALMQQEGFDKTYNLEGGIMKWEGEVNS